MLLVRRGRERFDFPHVRGEEGVCLRKSLICSLDEVSECAGCSGGTSVDILNPSIFQKLLRDASSDDSRTTRSRDQSHSDRSTLSSDLGRNCVRLSEGTTPVSTADRDDVELGAVNCTTDCVRNFRRAFHSKSHMAVPVPNSNESLEPGALTSGGLLLNGHHLHDFVLELVSEEVVDDLRLLDRQGEEEDVLKL